MRCLPTVLIALSLLTFLTPFAAAQGFYGSRPWLPSDVLRMQAEQSVDGGFGINLSPPQVHLLLGRLRPVRQPAVRPRIDQIFPSHIPRIYALPQHSHIRRTTRRHRLRKH